MVSLPSHPLPKRAPVALVQHPPVFLNLEASLEKALGLVREAAQGGARIIVFPETWLPGYPVWLDEAPRAGLWDHGPAQARYLKTPRPARWPCR